MYLAMIKDGRKTIFPKAGTKEARNKAITDTAVKNGIVHTTNKLANGAIKETCPK